MLEAILYTPDTQRVITKKNNDQRIYADDVVENFTVPVHVVHDTESNFFQVITRRFNRKYEFTEPENLYVFTPVIKK